MVLLTGLRQVGKTPLSQQLLAENPGCQYLNYDVPAHRAVLLASGWRQSAPLLVFDEIHKMRDWKSWLKGVVDGLAAGQSLLVTGSARMDTFRQAGESLAGRYFRLRLHPVSVCEWCAHAGATPATALTHLLARGGFPEPVLGDAGIRFENLVACHLLKSVQWQQDIRCADAGLHDLRTKDSAEVDFALSELVGCKLSDAKPHRALTRFAAEWPRARATQLVRELAVERDSGTIQVRDAGPWLAGLPV